MTPSSSAPRRRRGRTTLRRLLVAPIQAYQLVVSPVLGPRCRFYPSCSAYGVEAILRHGALRGLYLATRRLLRCHPWNPGGLDPVPPARGDVEPPAPGELTASPSGVAR